MHLLVIFCVHEVEVLAVVVQVLHFVLFEDRLIHTVFRREAVFEHGTATEVPQLGLHKPAQVTWRAMRDAEHGVQFVIELDHHARAHLGS